MTKITQKNFVLSIAEHDSPIIITVPHGGMKQRYSSWLENFFQPRLKANYNQSTKEIPASERIVLGGDFQIWHLVADILKEHPANAVMGLLPRLFIDYNRFIPEIAYTDKRLKTYYEYYHKCISKIIERLLLNHKKVILLDMHGFFRQPLNDKVFDFIIGSNNGETSPNGIDSFIYEQMKSKYQIFCADKDGLPKECDSYKGDTTNLYYYEKYNIDTLLIETLSIPRNTILLFGKLFGKIFNKI